MEATEALSRESNGLLARIRSLIDRAIDLDFSQPLAFAAFALVYVLSRIPWLDMGYGTDPDAWRVALTADYLWTEGEYLPSRLPGYPLHEFVTAGLIKGGWVLTNLSTVAVSLAGVYLFAQLAKKLELSSRGVLTLSFAFAPLLWINSVMTMDYMWSLTFILAAYLALLHRQPTAAGIALGVAAGFRLTALGMLVPFWLLLWRSDERGALRPLTLTSVAITLGVFTPALMEYGLNFLNFYDQSVSATEFVRRLGKDALGIAGALAVLGALALSLPRLRRLPGDLARDPNVLVWVAVGVVYFGSYTRLPHEIAYLIPVFPFGFFLLSRYVSRGLLVATLAIVVLAGFVDITSPEDSGGIGSSTVTSSRIGKGMLLSDLDTLDNQLDFARELRQVASSAAVEPPAVVIMGFIYPEFVTLYQDDLEVGILEDDLEAISQLSDKGMARDLERDVIYVWLLEYDQFRQYQEAGRRIYLTADAARSNFAVYGFRPGYFDAQELALSREDPSLGEGAASTDR